MTEAFLSGHSSFFGLIGLEVMENYEFEVLVALFGTSANPRVVRIDFPYYTFTLSYKY